MTRLVNMTSELATYIYLHHTRALSRAVAGGGGTGRH